MCILGVPKQFAVFDFTYRENNKSCCSQITILFNCIQKELTKILMYYNKLFIEYQDIIGHFQSNKHFG